MKVSVKKNPLVTVVIASYNHRSYVEGAIRSISNQKYDPIELIVVDDGSTDGSGEFLESLIEEYNFRLIRRENGGVVSVINMGIWEAKGDYVVFHASDDESLAGRISGQVRVLERYPNAAFVSGNVALVTEDGRDKGTLLPVTGRERELGFDDLFLRRARVSSVSSMYRARALREMGKINEEYRAEDPQIFLRITRSGYTWIQWAGPPVISYRMLFSSQSRTVMSLLIRQNQELIDEFSEHPHYRKAALIIRSSLISTLAEHDKKEALKVLKSGGLDVLSTGFWRAIIKLLVPTRWHHRFKKAGRQD